MRRLILVALAAAAAACSTQYQSRSFTGGFSEVQLSDRVYQVRFEGNDWTSDARASKLMLRRCAEITLERGFRYFELQDQQTRNPHKPMAIGMGHELATVRILDGPGDSPSAADAVLIVEQTNEVAKGALSPKARETLRTMTQASSK